MRNSKKVTVKGRNIVDLVFIVDKSKKNVACELCETAKHLENHIVFHIFPCFFPCFTGAMSSFQLQGLDSNLAHLRDGWEMMGTQFLGYYLLKNNGTHGYIILKMDSNPKICGPLSL